MNKLNPQQRQAVTRTDRHTLVLAGAGSGKTRVITEKIARLLGHGKVDPENIVAVTFTNKAAQEMRKRIAAGIGGKQAAGLSISTFHTLGLNIVRQACRELGYKRGFSIFDSTDAEAVLAELLKNDEYGYNGEPRLALWAISNLKNALTTPEQAVKAAADPQALALAQLYARYQRQLLAYNAVDFDDLILQPVRLLQSDADVRRRWQTKIHYLLVDEYQDTNAAQYQLVKLLLGENGRLTAVGDDDQSIYAWRGAQPENLNKLIEDFPGLEVIKLEQNYRSMGRILKCANQLIGNNPHHFEKRLWSELGYGDPVRVLPCATPEEEAERIVTEIVHLKFQKRCRNSDFAILYRGNHQSRPFESVLRLHDLPYKVSGGTAFFDRAEIKDILAYLRLIVNADDDAAFLRIINTPRREIGANTLEKLGGFAREHELSLLEACRHPDINSVLGSPARTRLGRFTDWLNELDIASREHDAQRLLKTVVDDIGYQDWLLITCKDKSVAESRWKNVEDLRDWVGRLCRREADTPEQRSLSLEDLVNKLALMDIIERNDNEKDTDAVQLMTLHAAKGLEFPHVFIAGFEDGLLPHHSSEEDETAVYEERRLAYVGITRAQRTLTLTFAQNRKKQGEMLACQPSRFLKELPEDDVQWEGTEDLPPEERKQRGNANINSLRNLLNNA
jgi:ATP-dependent DNA helicase Rep